MKMNFFARRMHFAGLLLQICMLMIISWISIVNLFYFEMLKASYLYEEQVVPLLYLSSASSS